MHDFRCADPHDMYHDELKKPAIFFKETKEGRKQMSEAVEKLVNDGFDKGRNEGRNENRQETAEKMIRDGVLSEEKIAQYSGLTVTQVRELKNKIENMAMA